jgi:Putative DNA-binding domain
MWTQQLIEQYIADRIEESQVLDYKAAGALDKHPEKKAEIQRDVSAFANAAGGVIIYGVREHESVDKKHLPERIDPISRQLISKEWLEQIIAGIQPRINGTIIHPVPLSSSPDDCCYVVEIPQSDTAHQASDGRYYRRYNFERRFMQDFEIRDTMNRSRNPVIEATACLHLVQPWEGTSYFFLKLRNTSKRMAQYFKCIVKLPMEAKGCALIPSEPRVLGTDKDGKSYLEFSLPTGLKRTPLFPGADELCKKELTLGMKWESESAITLQSIESVEIAIYADEMDPVVRNIPVVDILNKWS